MAEIGMAVGGRAAEEVVVWGIKKLLRPIFGFQGIVDDFHDQRSKLSLIQERIENELVRATRNAHDIYPNVQKWVDEVKTTMAEVERLENKLLAGNVTCCRWSWSPNWTCRCRFSNQLSEITSEMNKHCEVGASISPSSVARPPALEQDIAGSSSSSPGFKHSQSSKSAFDQTMEALKTDGIHLIGLYGGAGTGKTAVAKLVDLEAKEIGYRAILVNVSERTQVREIQGLLADFLGVKLKQLESEEGRAAQLRSRLTNGEKILIILDDVRREFNLGAVGILSSSNCGSCKILLTAHSRAHVSDSIQTQRDFQLGVLSEGESWALLENVAGVGSQVRAHDVAKNVIAACKGLPKPLVALGMALRGKSPSEWEEVLQQLRDARLQIIQGLKEETKELTLRQNRVITDVKMAEKNLRNIYPEVESWIKDVEGVIRDVEQLVTELKQSIFCFDEHSVVSKAEELTTSVKHLIAKGNFESISYPSPLEQDMELLSSEDFIFSESAKVAFDQIMEALTKDSVSMIGLYGMGGIGKTTLAKQVQKKVASRKIFDRVFTVTVSQKTDLRNIQDTIAEFVGLQLVERAEEARACRLKQRLRDDKILIILDDVWKKFDLETIGITPAEQKGCKLLLTTRRKDVCTSMNCRTSIPLNLLSEKEAQDLFKKKAVLSDEMKLSVVAKHIVEECKGLPIALATVGAALRNKGEDEYRDALDKLQNARLVDIYGVSDEDKNAYGCIQLSYDYLRHSTQAQFMLLLCSLFPEDADIGVEDLTQCAFGMNLFERVKSIEDARRQVRIIVRYLKDSCLLLDIDDGRYVKMHDVVRDVMLWVGATESGEKNVLTVRDELDMESLIKKESFPKCRAVSFMADSLSALYRYDELVCPNLQTIFIFAGDGKGGGEIVLPEQFFKPTKFLKVLIMKGDWRDRNWSVMPQSLDNLMHLRTLSLSHWVCRESLILRELRSLEILSLLYCEIDCELEILVLEMKELRLFQLPLGKVQENLKLGTFSKLEELLDLQVVETCKIGEGNCLSELKLLPKLAVLHVRIESASCIPADFCFPNLKWYIICETLNMYDSWYFGRRTCELSLTGKGEDESVTIDTLKNLLPNVRSLYLTNCNNLCSLPLLNFGAEGFLQKLEYLEVLDCKKMTSVFESPADENESGIIQLPSLTYVTLGRLHDLKHVWKGPTRFVSLRNLFQLRIYNCSTLTSIFSSPALSRSLQQLQTLTVEDCDNLEEVISVSGRGEDAATLSCCCFFTNLRDLKVSNCGKLETVIPIMKSAACGASHPQSRPCRLPNLENITLECNKELRHVFGHETEVGVECPSLQDLLVRDCPKMCTTHFVATQVQAPFSEPTDDVSMENIQLQGVYQQMRELQNTIICFSSLQIVTLANCNILKQVFTTASLLSSLPLLELLRIEKCSELEQVVVLAEIGDEKAKLDAPVALQNLRELKVVRCGKLRTIFPFSAAQVPNLEELHLERNGELEHVFGGSDWDSTSKHPALTHLHIVGCPKICAQSAAQIQNLSTQKTEKVTLWDIQGAEEIIRIEKPNDNHDYDENEWLGSDLNVLSLLNLVDLKCILSGLTQNIIFSGLGEIKVIGCNRLKHFFPVTMARSLLPALKKLIVRRCNELEQVIFTVGDGKEVSAEVGFEKLEVIYVSECEKLKTIFSTSAPLPKLRNLRLERNAELEHLFGESECNYMTSTWPDLEVLAVAGCPKICTQFVAIIKSQLQAQSTWKQLEVINLSNIQAIEELIQLQNQDDDEGDDEEEGYLLLKLEEVGELKRIWSGPTQNISFSFLSALRVVECKELKQLFTATMAATLTNLALLSVERCNDLEHVFIDDDNDGEEEGNEQLIEFPKLWGLRLRDLPKLINFCPPSWNLKLPLLTEKHHLKVEGCPQPITQFFAKRSYKQDGDEDGEEEEKEEEESEVDESDYNYNSKSLKELFGLL